MGVKIREKRGKLYLDIYQNGKRAWEALKLELTKDKAHNKEIWRLAEICRSKKEMQILAGEWGLSDPAAGKTTLVKLMEECAKTYKKPAPVKCCVKYIKEFSGGASIQLAQVTPKWVAGFQNFLLGRENLSRYSAGFYARLLRSALNKAVAQGLIRKNPAGEVTKIKAPEPETAFLQFEEVKALAKATVDNPYGAEVRRAFLFACYTGLRVSDIETLTWDKINTDPWQLLKTQEKTQVSVYIPLHKEAVARIDDGKKHAAGELVFNLSARTRRTSNERLKKWAEEAGFRKTVGWHTARRTFATMALESGADALTVAKLLGHASLSQVAKYAKVTDKLRAEAVGRLPEIGG